MTWFQFGFALLITLIVGGPLMWWLMNVIDGVGRRQPNLTAAEYEAHIEAIEALTGKYPDADYKAEWRP